MAALPIIDLLAFDDRPTFVLDSRKQKTGRLFPLFFEYANAAFHQQSQLFHVLFKSIGDERLRQDVLDWINASDCGETVLCGLTWHHFRVAERHIISVVKGDINAFTPDIESKRPLKTKSAVPLVPDFGAPRYWQCQVQDPLHGISFDQFVEQFDWSSTSFGPLETWCPELLTIWRLLLKDPNPAIIAWGEDFVMLYNEHYCRLMGDKHSQVFGHSPKNVFAETWDYVKSVQHECLQYARAVRHEDLCFFLMRDGRMEETFWTFSLVPICGTDGTALGAYGPTAEVTQEVISRRRFAVLFTINQHVASALSLKDFWKLTLEALEPETIAFPFAALYSLSMVDTPDAENQSTLYIGQLEGTTGLLDGAVKSTIDLNPDCTGIEALFLQALQSLTPLIIRDDDGSLPEHIINAVTDKRGFGDRCDRAAVIPLSHMQGKYHRGLLLLGLNPRRPIDAGVCNYTRLFGKQLSNIMASVILNEEAVRRSTNSLKQVAFDKAVLHEELLRRAQETKDAETKFSRVTELAPVAIFLLDPDGKPLYANQMYYTLLGLERGRVGPMGWLESIWEEDIPKIVATFTRCMQELLPITVEFRTKVPWTDSRDLRISEAYTTILASAYPELSDEGELLYAVGVMTDISTQKWTQREFGRRAVEALEAKRQQEYFIDMTSHEIRNPLNAIVQCADSIIEALNSMPRDATYRLIFEEAIASAETIAYCAQHQKRVVDDILTLSKLDSNLLTITQIVSQPREVLTQALKMFIVQAQRAEVQLQLTFDQSLTDLNIERAYFDPYRVLQVLINLITNAIKFTSTEPHRKIVVKLSASTEPLSFKFSDSIRWFPSRKERETFTPSGDTSQLGEEFHLVFSVEDTGRGLLPSEQDLLFERFAQASPRTHISYGGSGLGLFISRELTEMQGGEIGLDQSMRDGSRFVFYIKTWRVRSEPPKTDATDKAKQLPDSVAATAEALQAERHVGGPGELRFSNMAFLLVEDNILNQRVLQKQLLHISPQVYIANHGIEALEIIRNSDCWYLEIDVIARQKLSIILMDIEMPIMDGLTCARKIRELQAQGSITRHIPIIAITANVRTEQIVGAKEAGMDDVISKPFRMSELYDKIQQVLKRLG